MSKTHFIYLLIDQGPLVILLIHETFLGQLLRMVITSLINEMIILI